MVLLNRVTALSKKPKKRVILNRTAITGFLLNLEITFEWCYFQLPLLKNLAARYSNRYAEEKMNKLIHALITIVTFTILNGCTAPVYYKNVAYNDSQQALSVAKIDIRGKVEGVVPLENFIAKKAKIITPNRKISGLGITNKSWAIPKSGIDYLTEVIFIGLNGRADQIIKRHIFENVVKIEGDYSHPFIMENYDYLLWIGSKNPDIQIPQNAYDFVWWVKHKSGRYQAQIDPQTSGGQQEVTRLFFQKLEDFILKTEIAVRALPRFDSNYLIVGMTELELKSSYQAIKETTLTDLFNEN
jgi:hypothetical protein